MNWTKLKAMFPYAHEEILKMHQEQPSLPGDVLLMRYVESKGRTSWPIWINGLKEIEKEMESKITKTNF